MFNNSKVNVGIVGASGYSGEELLRLLLRHPYCNISFITSRQYEGKALSDVFPKFNSALKFQSPDLKNLIEKNIKYVFMALPHGVAAESAEIILEKGSVIIDISADFRLRSAELYKQYYGLEHPFPNLLEQAVYSLPELRRERIKNASLIACPGCYPTSILLPLIPLLNKKLISDKNIIISSGSGVSGAGRKAEIPYIFPECNESFRAYSPTGHRHISEIEQELRIASGNEKLTINFIPHLVPMNRGINSTIIVDYIGDAIEHVAEVYSKYYKNEQFIRILSNGKMADTKNVNMTNLCEIGHVYDKRTGKLIITSAIDNLTKGAAGQAVQCFNISCGFDEKTGLI